MQLAGIKDQLNQNPARLLNQPDWRQAAVALLVHHDESSGLQVLMIQRAKDENDPWSGHLALPGGRVEEGDANPKAAAERETLEEIGVNLTAAEFLGQLDDVDADRFPMIISCYVYGLKEIPVHSADPIEVADVFWLPLSCLEEDRRQREIFPVTEDPRRAFPAVKVPGKEQPLWGITYKILKRFLNVAVK